jgi:hypothetical protein
MLSVKLDNLGKNKTLYWFCVGNFSGSSSPKQMELYFLKNETKWEGAQVAPAWHIAT